MAAVLVVAALLVLVGARVAGLGDDSVGGDTNGDADYRRHLASVLTGRAVLAAAGA